MQQSEFGLRFQKHFIWHLFWTEVSRVLSGAVPWKYKSLWDLLMKEAELGSWMLIHWWSWQNTLLYWNAPFLGLPKAFLGSAAETIRSFIAPHFNILSSRWFFWCTNPNISVVTITAGIGMFSMWDKPLEGMWEECYEKNVFPEMMLNSLCQYQNLTLNFFQLPWNLLFITSSEYKAVPVKWDG